MGKAPKKGSASGGAAGLDAGEVLILKYLQTQNRPYSATDVFNNLHGKVGKTAVTKALTTLVEKGEISGKAYGKQWVYVARQDTLPAPSPEELDRLDSEIEGLKASVAEQREATRTVQTELNSLTSSMTNEEMAARIDLLEREIAAAEVKLTELRSGTRRVDPAEKAKVDAQYDVYSKEWRLRKRMCKEILDAITENLPQSPAAFMEELGMEADPVPISAPRAKK